MRRIRTLIADDEPPAREAIAALVAADAEFEVVGICADGRAAVDTIRGLRPDLAFLDVQMPGFGGIDAFEKLPPEDRPVVIFVTDFDCYAVRAFDAGAVDYLLKPLREPRFGKALLRAKEQIRRADFGELKRKAASLLEHLRQMEDEEAGESDEAPGRQPSRVVFKVDGHYLFAKAEEISWIEAQRDFVRLSCGGRVHRVRETLQGVEKRLDPRRFARVHRSFVVNVERIRKVMPALYGDYDVVMDDGTQIRLSRSYHDRMRSLVSRAAPRGLSAG